MHNNNITKFISIFSRIVRGELISDMHQFFQQDLMRMRLKNASELVNCIENLENKDELKIEAKVSCFITKV